MVKKDDEAMERWRRSGRQTAFQDIKLVDRGAKPGCLEFLIKAGLDRIPVVAPLMMKDATPTAALSAAALICSKKLIFESSTKPRYLTANFDSIVNSPIDMERRVGILLLVRMNTSVFSSARLQP